ncbi:MAG: ASKHA domain-containing protein [Candidatus Thorarchaeota archaeon]
MTSPENSKEFEVTFLPMDKKIESNSETTYLELARQAGIYIPSDCGGIGSCGKCRVIIESNPSPTSTEMGLLSADEIIKGIRLACEHQVYTDGHVQIVSSSMGSRILTHGAIVASEIESDLNLEGQYGIAFDVGTTTLVCYLMDLGSGSQIGIESDLNPQMGYGSDVVARIAYALGGPESVSELQSAVVGKLDEMVSSLLERHSIEPETITRGVVVGNTAMHHLLLGLNVYSLSGYPYTPKMQKAHRTNAKGIGFKSLDWTQFYFAPLIAGFVGSDAVAFMLARRLDQYEGVALGVDIGTNGEILLSKNGKLYCCSAAAGPAFEGASLTNGVRAQDGAIEYISIEDGDDRPKIATIDQAKPKGLCGTAIVDLTFQLWKKGLVDQGGRMGESERIITLDNNEKAYVILKRDEYGGESDIIFTQGDLRQVQLAKAAIQTGITILMKVADVSFPMLDGIYLAGAFGNYLRPESCMGLGLLPPVGLDKVVPVGNIAGEGAKLALLSTSQKELMSTIAGNVRYIELANQTDFAKMFTKNTRFPDLTYTTV